MQSTTEHPARRKIGKRVALAAAAPRFHSLETTTAATALLTGGVSGDRGAVLDAADLDATTRERAERGNATGARGAGAGAARAAELEVEGVDANLLQLREDLLRRHHGGVRGGLIAVGLHLGATGVAAHGLAAGDIRDVLRGRKMRVEFSGSWPRARMKVASLKASRVGTLRRKSKQCQQGCAPAGAERRAERQRTMKVSLKEAKRRQTPQTISPSRPTRRSVSPDSSSTSVTSAAFLGCKGAGGGSGHQLSERENREETGRAQRSAQGGGRARSSPLRTACDACAGGAGRARRVEHTPFWGHGRWALACRADGERDEQRKTKENSLIQESSGAKVVPYAPWSSRAILRKGSFS